MSNEGVLESWARELARRGDVRDGGMREVRLDEVKERK